MSTPSPILAPGDPRVSNWSILSRKRAQHRVKVWLYKDGELFEPALITVVEADEHDQWIKYLRATDPPGHFLRNARVAEGYDLVLDD